MAQTMKDLYAQYRKDVERNPFVYIPLTEDMKGLAFGPNERSSSSTEKSEIANIDEVIKLDRSVLDVCPPGHPDRASLPKPQGMRFYPIGRLTPQK